MPFDIKSGILIGYDEEKGSPDVVIPGDVTVIGTRAFYKCRSIVSVTIPDSVTDIEDSAFAGCTNLEKITVSTKLIHTETNAFDKCGRLTRLRFPEGLKEIDYKVYHEFGFLCPGIATIEIPRSVKSFDKFLFDSFRSLSRIEIDSGSKSFSDIDGVVFSPDHSALIMYPRARKGEYIIPEGTEKIGRSAFSYCEELTGIVFPDSIKEIGSEAFERCKSLYSVKLPPEVEKIYFGTFNGCVSLESAEIPQGVSYIGSGAFEYCKSLKSVNIPESVKEIRPRAFRASSLAAVKIPKGTQSVGSFAFDMCENIKITIYTPVTFDPGKIVNDIFHNTNHVIAVRSRETGELKYEVPLQSDNNQYELRGIVISSWSREGEFDFTRLDEFFPKITGSHNRIMIAASRLEYPVQLSPEAEKRYRKFLEKKSCAVYAVSREDTRLLDLVAKCGGIKKNNISELIQYTTENRLPSMTAALLRYRSEHFGSRITQADEFSLDEGKPDRSIEMKLGLTEYTVTELKKHYRVESTGEKEYSISKYSDNDTEVKIPASLKGGRKISAIGEETFKENQRITSVVIPGSVKYIGKRAFFGCGSLAAAELNPGLERIERWAFYHCDALKSIAVPEGVNTIGEWAFTGCTALTEAFIPASVTKIGYQAFKDCPGLVITAPEGSYAAEYAQENGIAVKN